MKNFVQKIRKCIGRNNRLERDIQVFRNIKKILDIGCGKGQFLRLCGNRGIGIDGSKDNITHCREAGLNAVEVLLPNRLPFEDHAFDGICCSHFIEHFLPKDVLFICQEIDRVLQPGGTLLIRSPIYSKEFFDDPTHIRPYHLHSIFHLLGGWEEYGTRQIIIGEEQPKYKIVSYYEEIYPFYVSSVAPTISPRMFPVRLFLRGVGHVLSGFGIGCKRAYGAVLTKMVRG
jgi:SAM-dependent methyltransferase